MNVFLFCRSYFPSIGGIETSIYQLSKTFSALGHTVKIFTTSQKPEKERKEYAQIRYANPVRKPLNLIPSMNLFCLKRSVLAMLDKEEEKPDLIISRDSFLTCVANERYHDVPVVYISSMDVKKFIKTRKRECANLKQLISKFLETWAYSIEIKNQEQALYGSDYNIVFCEGMKSQLKESYFKKVYEVNVCYPGCTLENVDFAQKKQGIKPRFLFVGRISAEKNLPMLFEALKYITEEMQLTIVGDGDGIGELRSIAKQLGENIQVNFEGYQNEPLKYYMNTDYFILPSKYESFGQVVIESFTCGVPVIGFCSIEGKTNTAIGELVEDKITGFVCKEFSAEALAQSIRDAIILMRQPEKKIQMDKECKKYANEKCSWMSLTKLCIELGGRK